MNNDIEEILVGFNNEAEKEFFFLFEKFKSSVKSINRKKDDNVFQMQKAKYVFTLKEQLENLAKELIEKNRSSPGISLLNRSLTSAITFYLNEFRQKSDSL